MAGKSLGYRSKVTQLAIRSFVRNSQLGKASTKKLADGGGLYLQVTPAGTALCRIKYRFAGKERSFAPKSYPTGIRTPVTAVKGR
jgi:hypothetical protein